MSSDFDCRTAFASVRKLNNRLSLDSDCMLVYLLLLGGARGRIVPATLQACFLHLRQHSLLVCPSASVASTILLEKKCNSLSCLIVIMRESSIFAHVHRNEHMGGDKGILNCFTGTDFSNSSVRTYVDLFRSIKRKTNSPSSLSMYKTIW